MHRTATFYDLRITARGMSRAEGKEDDYEADPKPLRELVGYIEQLYNGGDRIVKKGQSDKTARIYISDFKYEGERAVFLINRSDPNAPDAVSSDPDIKSRVVHEKPPGHGGDYSAHVVINLDPVKGDNYYLCVLETVYGSGLHASSMAEYLRYLIRRCRLEFKDKFKIAHSSRAKTAKGEEIMVNWNHFVELQGHPSEDFERDINAGTLSGMELVSFSEVGAAWDERGGIVEHKRSIQLKPAPDKLGDIAAAIRQVRNKVYKNGKEYDHIRISFKNEAGEPRDATIASDTGQLVDSHKYVKRHIIHAPMVNTTSLERVSPFILKEVLALMG
ncbi:hypothetical protein Pstr01_30020 [Pseudomonas straminea]|uniref:Uncharacterized protein n=2 Tax=Pseudomonas straminea TaxID=47882 RepID=A0A1I1WCC5_PSEOC|nr:hypothetical protein Pstr01_30020 [Pseudomonas straminea]SFD92794.1 hypothetical protein SAMN05216372_105400 [Pseudomonas straminea]